MSQALFYINFSQTWHNKHFGPGAILVPETVLSTNVTWSDSALIGSLSTVLCGDWENAPDDGEGDSDPRWAVETVNSGLL